ncbi:MAG: hypothetical protein AAF399_29760, partial [Bacteroidota bacterium]
MYSPFWVFFVLFPLLLGTAESPSDPTWIPYTTQHHLQMGTYMGLSQRITRYLVVERGLKGPILKSEFNRWYLTNLGHVFEDAALRSYRVGKNQQMYNGRIPDGVEDGMLEQLSQYTHFHASTFIEVK